MLLSLAIARRPDWAEVLKAGFHHRLEDEKFDAKRGKERFVYRGRPEDPEDFPGCRRAWFIGDKPTPYPIIEYELKVP